jgi:hypothetical protein
VQLDQARIAICERSWADNLDLALHVIRAHGAALAICALAGILPAIGLNVMVIQAIYPDAFQENASTSAYYLAMILVMIEAPLATAPITLYLGHALFVEKPRPGQVARGFVACLPQMLLLQVLLRTVFIVPVLTWIIPYALWPYLNEVILLERNPLSGRAGQTSTLNRNSLLHRGNSGDFVVRALGAMVLAAMLIVAIDWTETILLENIFGFQPEWIARAIELQIALWLVAIFFTVSRFLSYLDQRIRNEGWEVELFLRAQRERLTRHVA